MQDVRGSQKVIRRRVAVVRSSLVWGIMLVSSSGPESEARNDARYSVHKIVSFLCRGRQFLSLTLNLGLNGMRVETSHYLPKDEPLDIQLVLGRESISLKGRVVYSQSLSEGRYVSGVQFLEIPKRDRSALKNYLATLKGQEGEC